MHRMQCKAKLSEATLEVEPKSIDFEALFLITKPVRGLIAN